MPSAQTLGTHVAAVLVVAGLLGLGGCRAPELDADDADASGFAQLRALRQREDVPLPTALPPGFVSLGASQADGMPIVDFHSGNEPLVSICSGSVRHCREVLEFGDEIRTVDVSGTEVLVGVSASDTNGGTSTLSEEVAAFWREAELSFEAPAWLPEG